MAAPTSESADATRAAARTATNSAAARRVVRSSAIPWIVVPAIVVGLLVGLLVNWVVGVAVGVVAGVAIGIGRTVMLRAATVVGLRNVFGGEPATPQDHPRLENLVEGLCVSTGIAEPSVVLVDDPGANVATFGPPDDAVLVVTTGLLGILGRVELEAVLAEALARIQQRDAELAGVVATFTLGRLVRGGPNRPGSVSTRGLGRAAAAAEGAFEANRHLQADLAAVAITRYPPALRAAIESMVATGTAVAGATWGSAHCWMCDPLGAVSGPEAEQLAAALRTHPDPGLRINLLGEL